MRWCWWRRQGGEGGWERGRHEGRARAHPKEEADQEDADDGDGDEGARADREQQECVGDGERAYRLPPLLHDHADRDAVQERPEDVEGKNNAVVEDLGPAGVNAAQGNAGHCHEHVDKVHPCTGVPW